ncbi:MAG TPA: hypothetical protein PKD00_00010 [Burkholderiales bacterium]|nr:hypothetical protein [Burkholderiales bacterium]
MQIKKGVTRIVLLIGNYAIKFPNFTFCHLYFLSGCYNNWSERNYCKVFKKHSYIDKVAPCYYCSIFGLFAIYARCKPLERKLTDTEKEYYKHLHDGDDKKENFGYYKNRLVCLDYP